jgi:CRP-like cAMP-binding protein
LGVISVGKAGDVIGEMGVLANQLRAASCTAMVETTALHIHQTDLWDLLERNATLSASVIRVLVPKLLSYSEKRYSIKNGLDYKQVRNMPYSYKGDFMGNSPAR